MKSISKNFFLLLCAALISQASYASNPKCYDDLSYGVFADGYMSSMMGGSGSSSVASGGAVGIGFGLPMIAVGSMHANQIRYTLKFKQMYNESLLGEGPTLDELAKYVFNTDNPNESVDDAAYSSMSDIYQSMIESGELCSQYEAARGYSKSFTLEDVAKSVKSKLN